MGSVDFNFMLLFTASTVFASGFQVLQGLVGLMDVVQGATDDTSVFASILSDFVSFI